MLDLGGGAAQLDITLQLDRQNEAVDVTANGIALDPANTQSGETLSRIDYAVHALNGRSFTDLLALQPGVIPASSQQPNAVLMAGVTSAPPSGGLNPGNLSVSGQRETANGSVVNGSDVEETVNMGTAIVPNFDSIAEFRVLTNNFDASMEITAAGRSSWSPNRAPTSCTAMRSNSCAIRTSMRAIYSRRIARNSPEPIRWDHRRTGEAGTGFSSSPITRDPPKPRRR